MGRTGNGGVARSGPESAQCFWAERREEMRAGSGRDAVGRAGRGEDGTDGAGSSDDGVDLLISSSVREAR